MERREEKRREKNNLPPQTPPSIIANDRGEEVTQGNRPKIPLDRRREEEEIQKNENNKEEPPQRVTGHSRTPQEDHFRNISSSRRTSDGYEWERPVPTRDGQSIGLGG